MEILIVDDKPENLYLLESLLKGSGFETISAKNGAEALGLAKKYLPDIIISDILMPVMDGYTFCSECKKDEQLKSIPFIFYTATYTNPKDEEFALNLGANKFILKPQEPDVFIDLIKSCIAKKSRNSSHLDSSPELSENVILKQYNETLIRKLEDKMLQTAENEKKLKNYVKELEENLAEKLKIEKALMESEEQNRLILENSMDAILFATQDGTILSANKAACEMFQMSEDELCRLERNGLVDLNDPRYPVFLIRKEQSNKVRSELTFIRKDMSKFEAEISSSNFVDNNGRPRTSFIIKDITERKEAEEALLFVQNLVDALLLNTPDNIYFKDLESRFIRVSKAQADYFNLPNPAAAIGKTDFDFFSAEHAQNAFNDEQNLIKTGIPIINKEEKEIWKDGSESWVSTTKQLLTDSDGEIFGTFGISRDITERKLAENRIKLLAHSIKSISECISITDEKDIIIFVNEAFLKTYGYTEKELIGKHISIVQPKGAKSIKNVENILPGTLQGGWKGEVINRRKDGTEFPIYLSTSVIQDENNEPIALIGVATDITEKRESEDKLRKLSEAVEQSPVSIFITNQNGIIEYANPKFSKITGYTYEEAVGKNPRIFSSGQTPEAKYEELWDTILAGKTWIGELLNKKKNGELYWKSASISPIINDEGDITHFISVSEDITEKKKMLKNVISAKEKAEQSDKFKTEFLAQISHEIRSPMSAILSFANLAEDELKNKLTPELSEYFLGINMAGKRLMRSIDLIINASEMHLGTYKPLMKNIELIDTILTPLFNEYYPNAKNKGLEFSFSTELQKADIFGDQYSLTQIFANLFDNAINYTEKGKIVVGLRRIDYENIEVSVSDTGIGMSEEFLENIFQLFKQEQQGYSRQFDGNGLGLSLVKYFCDLNGAKICVTSEKDMGTIFVINFSSLSPENL
ncbi:MAG: PAS domain S-box protein [Bacteroidetes bacterium]|nr:PAS domain S-box protein [Bacteroidota bacterium]